MTKEIKHQICGDGFIQYRPAKTPPPWNTWVGLTKDEVEILAYKAEGNTWKAVELAEAKLKEKNT